MRKIILLLCLIICAQTTQGADLPLVPSTTMQIAKNFKINQTPSSRIVRVGIGTNNFQSYEWNNVSIYGTGEFDIYNGETYLSTFDSNNVVKIIRDGIIFTISDMSGKEIAKVMGPIKIKTDFGFLGVKDLRRAGKDAIYRGELEIVPCIRSGKFHIVNVIELEQYLKGVVPNEMPVRFGLNALKAQTVAARNYVLSPRVKGNPNYDVVDSVASQVYFGANTENEISNKAVKETAGVVALYDWELILAQYSSTAGGYSESFSNAFSEPFTKEFPAKPKPYLLAKPDYENILPLNTEEAASEFYKSKPDSYDVDSPYFRWEREWNGQEIQDSIQSTIATQSTTGFIKPAVAKGQTIGIIKKLNVIRRGDSGKIMELEIQTDNGNYIVQKELVIRRLITNKGKALPSANVIFEHEYNETGDLIYVKAYGGGFGHGVGLSQYGAGFMGKNLNKSYDKILKHYYSNITLGTEPITLNNTNKTKSQEVWLDKPSGTIVIDNNNNFKSLQICVNGISKIIELDTNERYNRINISENLKQGMNNLEYTILNSENEHKQLKLYMELISENDNNN